MKDTERRQHLLKRTANAIREVEPSARIYLFGSCARGEDLAQLYNDVFAKRQDVDYMDLFRLDSTVVGALLPRAESFVFAIEELVRARCSAESD